MALDAGTTKSRRNRRSTSEKKDRTSTGCVRKKSANDETLATACELPQQKVGSMRNCSSRRPLSNSSYSFTQLGYAVTNFFTTTGRQEDRFHIAVRFHTRLIKTLDNMLNYSVNESKILDSEVVLGCLEFVSCSRSALLIKTLRWTQMSGRAISRSAYSVIFDLVSLHTFTKKSPDLMLRNCASECSTASMQPETVAVVSNEPLHAGWPSFPSVRQSIYPRDTSNYGACLRALKSGEARASVPQWHRRPR